MFFFLQTKQNFGMGYHYLSSPDLLLVCSSIELLWLLLCPFTLRCCWPPFRRVDDPLGFLEGKLPIIGDRGSSSSSVSSASPSRPNPAASSSSYDRIRPSRSLVLIRWPPTDRLASMLMRVCRLEIMSVPVASPPLRRASDPVPLGSYRLRLSR